MKNFPYNDIVNLPHHVSASRQPMSSADRAAQFAPFAALTGYEDAVAEAGRITGTQIELDEQQQVELNRRFNLLMTNITRLPEVEVEYFVPDMLKSGGEYVVYRGVIKKVSISDKRIIFQDDTVIQLNMVVALNGKIFDEL
ncbi:MAG: hypothetical protein MST10_03740 [Lentisphaeria bacterium]|nr:hypothetical protein [Lentisphaeria bacterium]